MTEPVENPARPTAVIVLAAGNGTRMKSKLMKVLHPLGGRTMIGHVLTAAQGADPRWLVTVVGHGRDQVGEHVRAQVPDAVIAVQETQEGTAQAVRVGLEALRASAGTTDGVVVVMSGDTPLLEADTLRGLVGDHAGSGRAVTVLTGEVADPTGYGRVIRGPGGAVSAIVEEKDATAAQRAVPEISSGIFAFDGAFLAEALPLVRNDNAKGEYYLPDVVALAVDKGRGVGAFRIDDVVQTEGANDRAQLAGLAAELNRRVLLRWMRDGVTVVDPASTWVDVTVSLARDVTLRPGVQLHGATTVAEDAVIGPDCTLTDVQVGERAQVVRTHGSGAVIGAGATVGPFSYLRPGSRLGRKAKVGGFVETKNSELGDGAKVPHLSYVGDATIGAKANIGAGTIVANYDGLRKSRTTIGEAAFVGSDTVLIAPVEVGPGAYVGAGSAIGKDVPAGNLGVTRAPQRNIDGWTARKRPGTPSSAAAEKAAASDDQAASAE